MSFPRPRLARSAGVCVALAFAAVGAASPPAGNLLSNSSFEQRSGAEQPDEPWGRGALDGVARSPFAHWGYSGFWDGGNYDIKLGPGRTGRLCARLVCREKGRGGISTEALRVAPGTKLQFKGWFKTMGARRHLPGELRGRPRRRLGQHPAPRQERLRLDGGHRHRDGAQAEGDAQRQRGNLRLHLYADVRRTLDRRRDAYPDCGITRRRRVGWDTLAQARRAPLDIHRSGRVSCGRR